MTARWRITRENQPVAVRLYRSMREGSDGQPERGRTARTLGVRPGVDILLAEDGSVAGGQGGMSVAPDSLRNLPAHRRPPEHRGTGKDPIWEFDVDDLGDGLVYREDPLMPGVHGFVEPAARTMFEEYESAVWAMGDAWRLL
jgi:hypothetical protein